MYLCMYNQYIEEKQNLRETIKLWASKYGSFRIYLGNNE